MCFKDGVLFKIFLLQTDKTLICNGTLALLYFILLTKSDISKWQIKYLININIWNFCLKKQLPGDKNVTEKKTDSQIYEF